MSERKIPTIWIKISDKIPPDAKPVLTYTPGEESPIEVDESYMKNGKLKWLYGSRPTHWMPLPEHP